MEEKRPKPYQYAYRHAATILPVLHGLKTEQISGYLCEIIKFYKYKEMCSDWLRISLPESKNPINQLFLKEAAEFDIEICFQ